MSEWSMFAVRNGVRYTKDRKMVSKSAVPTELLDRLEVGKVFNDKGVEQNVINKSCIFCGAAGNCQKLLDAKIVYLCEDDYYNKNVGQIAQTSKRIKGARTWVSYRDTRRSSGWELKRARSSVASKLL
jgi:hypothetical protein